MNKIWNFENGWKTIEENSLPEQEKVLARAVGILLTFSYGCVAISMLYDIIELQQNTGSDIEAPRLDQNPPKNSNSTTYVMEKNWMIYSELLWLDHFVAK